MKNTLCILKKTTSTVVWYCLVEIIQLLVNVQQQLWTWQEGMVAMKQTNKQLAIPRQHGTDPCSSGNTQKGVVEN